MKNDVGVKVVQQWTKDDLAELVREKRFGSVSNVGGPWFNNG